MLNVSIKLNRVSDCMPSLSQLVSSEKSQVHLISSMSADATVITALVPVQLLLHFEVKKEDFPCTIWRHAYKHFECQAVFSLKSLLQSLDVVFWLYVA